MKRSNTLARTPRFSSPPPVWTTSSASQALGFGRSQDTAEPCGARPVQSPTSSSAARNLWRPSGWRVHESGVDRGFERRALGFCCASVVQPLGLAPRRDDRWVLWGCGEGPRKVNEASSQATCCTTATATSTTPGGASTSTPASWQKACTNAACASARAFRARLRVQARLPGRLARHPDRIPRSALRRPEVRAVARSATHRCPARAGVKATRFSGRFAARGRST